MCKEIWTPQFILYFVHGLICTSSWTLTLYKNPHSQPLNQVSFKEIYIHLKFTIFFFAEYQIMLSNEFLLNLIFQQILEYSPILS